VVIRALRVLCVSERELMMRKTNMCLFALAVISTGCASTSIMELKITAPISPEHNVVDVPQVVQTFGEPLTVSAVVVPFEMRIDKVTKPVFTKTTGAFSAVPSVDPDDLTEQQLTTLSETLAKSLTLLLRRNRAFSEVSYAKNKPVLDSNTGKVCLEVVLTTARNRRTFKSVISVSNSNSLLESLLSRYNPEI